MSIVNDPSSGGDPRNPDSIAENQNDECFLFCTLAITLDILSAAQVEEIVEAWSNDSGLTIAKFAVTRGFITEQQCEILNAAVGQLVPNDEEGPQSSIVEDMAADEDVQALLQEFKGKDINMADFFGLANSGESVVSNFGLQQTDRFDVLHSHAKGGLGEIFLAKDKELNREVAIKKIQNWHSDNSESCERFILEAEITGRLEHPGIVPVYGMGMDDEKRPFYAMRLIQGNSLKEELQEFHSQEKLNDKSLHSVRFRKLLSNFVDICQAVSYAHSRGVLHRDLKPSNIILGKYGEALVVDWGLAKVLGSNETSGSDEEAFVPSSGSSIEITVQGRIIGTPAYMSPEQAMGSSETLDERTDVYSLGATLYTILTGHPPFASSREILKLVQTGNFDSPLVTNPKLSKPLVAICEKAMSTSMNERYRTPRDLAADIDLWLADEPVSAHAEQRTEKLGRIYRRNRSVFAVSTVFLCLLAFSALGAAYVLAAKNHQLQLSQQSILDQRDTAIKNLESVRSLGSVVLWIQEQVLATLPEKKAHRHVLAKRTNNVMASFYAQNPSNRDAAVSYVRSLGALASLEMQLKANGPSSEHFETALTIVEALRESQPVTTKLEERECHLYTRYAILKKQQGLLEEGIPLLAKAKRLAERLVENSPESIEYRRRLSMVDTMRASFAYAMGDNNVATETASSAVRELEWIRSSPESKLVDLTSLLNCYDILRAVAINEGEIDVALGFAEQACQEAITENNKNGTQSTRYQCHRTRIKRLEVLVQKDSRAPLIATELAELERDTRQLIDDFPEYTLYKKNLARCLIYSARYGDPTVARKKLDEAISYLTTETMAEFRELWIEAHMERAKTHKDQKKAAEDLDAAFNALTKLMQDLPNDPELIKKLETLKELGVAK
jgi:serine/threonine-protein kinase